MAQTPLQRFLIRVICDNYERAERCPAPAFAELLRAFRDAGVQQVLVWPVTDEERQLELFCEQVIPLVAT